MEDSWHYLVRHIMCVSLVMFYEHLFTTSGIVIGVFVISDTDHFPVFSISKSIKLNAEECFDWTHVYTPQNIHIFCLLELGICFLLWKQGLYKQHNFTEMKQSANYMETISIPFRNKVERDHCDILLNRYHYNLKNVVPQ